MRVTVWPSPNAITETLSGTCIVIDVLRATSTILQAMENGAAWIQPVVDTASAFALREAHPELLLGGERNALLVPGFDLSNSPFDYTVEKVVGKGIVLTTTNGTRALYACTKADNVYIACFRNAKAVAKKLSSADMVHIVCSGTAGLFTLEDGLCAGAILDCLPKVETDDMGVAMIDLYRRHKEDLFALLQYTSHTRRLLSLGFTKDIGFCLTQNVSSTVPSMKNGRITLDKPCSER